MGKCIDLLYDIFTVCISIADITTDVIVLLSFYYKSRTTFFIISLIILILAHIAYSIAFILRYNVVGKWGIIAAILTFFLSLPIASTFSFLLLFTENPNSCFSKWFKYCTNLDVNNSWDTIIFSSKERSDLFTWMINKFSKHFGFIIEAGFESLPQSLLQITAIVYYKETNYISMASIFLSMISVMTKSLVFSQGIDIKTYIWTWLCIVVDFFGIFFTLSWVFYTNNASLQPVFLGYLSIIGQMWLYKVIICILPIVVIAIILWFTYFMPKMIDDEIWYSVNSDSFCQKVWQTMFVVVFGSIGISLISPIGLIGVEIFCFSLLAYVLYEYSTERWSNYSSKSTNDMINGIINFVSKPSTFNKNGDRMVRLLAINNFCRREHDKSLIQYINRIDKQSGLSGLKKVKYGDIRNNTTYESQRRRANIWPEIWLTIKNKLPDKDDYYDIICCTATNCGDRIEYCCDYVFFFWFFVLLAPPFVFGKLFQVIFPYIIVAYLIYHNEWNEIHVFQLVMLFIYIGLQIILLLLGLIVCRLHWWLWHIQAGRSYVYNYPDKSKMLIQAKEWYLERAAYPFIEKFILEMYGNDIGNIIMDYFHSIEIYESA